MGELKITIPSPSGMVQATDGYKTYAVVALGAAAIVLNHFGMLPHWASIPNNPADWVNDLYKLVLVATGRSALNK